MIVVGSRNVQIHLYKIEAQREYPITWKEVSRNSGGEGFLSAFVILSSLLYYMRRDDTDILQIKMRERFWSWTTRSHRPMPPICWSRWWIWQKEQHTAICLTGLGGESIYNRFDNIYVLNLIAASLRGGTQYLKRHEQQKKGRTGWTCHCENWSGGSDGAVVLTKSGKSLQRLRKATAGILFYFCNVSSVCDLII